MSVIIAEFLEIFRHVCRGDPIIRERSFSMQRMTQKLFRAACSDRKTSTPIPVSNLEHSYRLMSVKYDYFFRIELCSRFRCDLFLYSNLCSLFLFQIAFRLRLDCGIVVILTINILSLACIIFQSVNRWKANNNARRDFLNKKMSTS